MSSGVGRVVVSFEVGASVVVSAGVELSGRTVGSESGETDVVPLSCEGVSVVSDGELVVVSDGETVVSFAVSDGEAVVPFTVSDGLFSVVDSWEAVVLEFEGD